MEKRTLTERFLEKISPPEAGREEYPDAKRPGLYLRVSSSGRATWMFEKRVRGGAKRKHTLGPYPGLSLREAREEASAIALEADRGVDRVLEAERQREQEKQEQQQQALAKHQRTTVKDALERYQRIHLQTLRSCEERRRAIDRAFGSKITLPFSEFSRADLQSFIDRKAEEAPVAANRMKAALSHFAAFAWKRGYIPDNIGSGLSKAVKESPRDRVLSLGEVNAIWLATFNMDGPWGSFMRLLMLTVQRREEIASLRGRQINLRGRRLELPSRRTKNGMPHVVPLPTQALGEIEDILLAKEVGPDDYLFTTNGSSPIQGFSKMKARLDSLLDPNMEPWTLHDLRTAFATALAEDGFPEAVVDRVLNHVASGSAPSAVSRVYNKSHLLKQRMEALARWAHMVEGSYQPDPHAFGDEEWLGAIEDASVVGPDVA